MVDLIKIYDDIKSAFANDAELMKLISGNLDSPKVFIGRDMPAVFISPAIQIVGMTDVLNYPFDYSNVVLRTNVYAMGNVNGTIPYSNLSAILNRVYDILKLHSFNLSAIKVFNFSAETRDSDATQDLNYAGTMKRYLMGMEWRLIAV